MTSLNMTSDVTTNGLPAAVLFDMDGTLLDTERMWLQAEILVMSELGGEWTQADQAHLLGGPLERAFAYMQERSGTDLSAQAVGEMLLGHMDTILRREEVAWRLGARELLVEAHALGLPTALVTASWRSIVDAVHDRIAEDIGREPFGAVIAGDELPDTKPHPAPYLRAAELLGADIGDCLALEDSPTGVMSASTAGAFVIAIPHIAPIAMGPRIRTVHTLEGQSIASLWAYAAAG